MATHGDVGLSQPAPSTITHRLDAISLDANSTTVLREVMVLGSPETTNALTAVLGAAPNNTAWGAVVRVVGGQSSAAEGDGGLAIHGNKSSNSSVYLPVRLTNGTAFIGAATDYLHNSTADFTGSTVAGPMHFLRSGAAAGGSTDHTISAWGSSNGAAYAALVTSTGVNIDGSTTYPAVGVAALHVRQPLFDSSQYAQSTTFNDSSVVTLASSAANQAVYLYAYSITSTVGAPTIYEFRDGATVKWSLVVSSGYGGANVAVSPPAYLFKTASGSSLVLQTGSSNRGISVSASYFRA
jgi:hypothetical protein